MNALKTVIHWILWLLSWPFAIVLAPIVWVILLAKRVVEYQLDHYQKKQSTEAVWVKFKGYRKKGE